MRASRSLDPDGRGYLFFFEQLKQLLLWRGRGGSLWRLNIRVAARVDECFQTFRNALMVVLIDLHKDDDPQVIFETLNARGERLLPADLLRNYIFFRASRDGLDIEASGPESWARFDEEFWREEVKQGRLTRPRSDLFIQHFLASRQGQDIPIKHLYVEYRHWLEAAKPFSGSDRAELAALAVKGTSFANRARRRSRRYRLRAFAPS